MAQINWDEVNYGLTQDDEESRRNQVRRDNTYNELRVAHDTKREQERLEQQQLERDEEWWITDVGRGIGNGAIGALQSTVGLADTVVEAFGGDLVDDELLEHKVFGETHTLLGGLAEGITQFSSMFVSAGALGVASLAGKAAKAYGFASKTAKAIGVGARGMAADFIGFRGNEENVSNMFEGTFLENPVTTFMSNDSEEDDSIGGRLKNTLEGLGMGGFFHMLGSLKKVKKVANSTKHLDDDSKEKAIKEVLSLLNKDRPLEDHLKSIEDFMNDGKKLELNAARTPKGVPIMADPEDVVKAAEKLAELVAKNPEKILDEVSLAGIVDSLNLKNIQSVDEAKVVWKLLDEVLEKQMDAQMKIRSHPTELKAAKAQLTREATTASSTEAGVAAGVSRIMADAKAYKGVTKSIIQGKILQATLAEQAANYASIMKLLDPDSLKYADYKEALVNTLRTGAQFKVSIKSMVSEAARATSAGQIKIKGLGKHLDEEDILKHLKNHAKDVAIDNNLLDRIRFGETPEAFHAGLVKQASLGSKANKYINEYYTNALLGGSSTQSVNIISTFSNVMSLPFQRVLGGAIQADKAQMLAGVRTFGAYANSLQDSLQMMWKSLKAGEPILDQAHKFDGIEKAIHGNGIQNGVMRGIVNGFGNLVRLPTRVLGGTDEFFKQMAYRSEMTVMLMEEGIEKGLKGDGLEAFISAKRLSSFSDDGRALNEGALAVARKATFTTPLEKGSFLKGIESLANKHPGGRLILPFIRTPVNIMKDATSMMPGVQKIMKENRLALASGDPRQIAQATGRIAMGQTLFGGAMVLSMNGQMTGGGPSDPVQLAQLKATGWQPYSINIGGTWVEMRRLDPWAGILGLGADLAEFQHEFSDADLGDVVAHTVSTLSDQTINKTFFKGLSDILQAVSEPKRAAGRTIEQFVSILAAPNLARDAAQAGADIFGDGSDDLMRETRDVMDKILAKFPGTSKNLDPRRDVLGKPVTAMLGPLGGRQSLVKTSTPKQNLVYDTIAKLPVTSSAPSETMGGIELVKYRNPKTGQSAYDRLQELTGTTRISSKTLEQKLDSVIRGAKFKRLAVSDVDGTERAAEIDKIVRRYRSSAKRKLLQEHPKLKQIQDEIKQERRIARSGVQREEYEKTESYLAYLERIN